MQYALTLHNAGKLVAQYRGTHPVSGQIVSMYLPYDQTISLLSPPTYILATIDPVTKDDMELIS